MSSDLIVDWLQLPPGNWPPDHYTLLGLERGHSDIALVEQRVHERMEQMRRYQLIHPEPATEAMNRLAQALVCLTDPEAKKAYDAALFNGPSVSTAAVPNQASLLEGAPADPFAWLFQEPPRREAAGHAFVSYLGAPGAAVSLQDLPPLASVRGHGSSIARKLHERVGMVRKLFHAWQKAGRYLGESKRVFELSEEVSDLQNHLHVIRTLLGTLFPAMAEVDQPGYLMLALSRQQIIVPTLRALVPSQRERLAHDWRAGHALIRAGLQELHEELRGSRKRRRKIRTIRLAWRRLAEHSEDLLFLLAVIALDLAYPPLREWWLYQAVGLGGLLTLRLLSWGQLRTRRLR